jgi:hypothetical protein
MEHHLASSCEDYYRDLYAKSGEVLAASFTEGANLQCESHSFVLDFGKWIDVLTQRPEVVLFRTALREYQFALLAVALGYYRQAFMGLRMFLEHSLAGIQFSATELELRIWLRGERNIVWESLVEPENGVFSVRFAKAFCDTLSDYSPEYASIARKLYHECSEYVHGNPNTSACLPDHLEYCDDIFLDWHEKARSTRLVITYALALRYLSSLNAPQLAALESETNDVLGHIPAVRSFFE